MHIFHNITGMLKKNLKTAQWIPLIYQAFGSRLLHVHVFVKYVQEDTRSLQSDLVNTL